MDVQSKWSGVRERVVALVEGRHRAYGWESPERAVFEPVLTDAEIAEVEAQYGVELPEEYRTFLAEVGAGGPGPELKLTSLRRVDGKWGWIWEDGDPILLDPGGPFVETEVWAEQQVTTLRTAGYEPTTRDADDDYLHDYCEAFGEAGARRWAEERDRGAIVISDDGCGVTNWLVIVGPHRGELRYRDVGTNPPYEPLVDEHGNRHDFRTWYLEWLERRERREREA